MKDATATARDLAKIFHAINQDNEFAVGGPLEHLVGLFLFGSEESPSYLDFIEHCDPRNILDDDGNIVIRRIQE